MKKYVLVYLISLIIAFLLAVFGFREKAYSYLYLRLFIVFFITSAAFYLISYIFAVKLALSSKINSELAICSINLILMLQQSVKVLLISSVAGCSLYLIDFQYGSDHELFDFISYSSYSKRRLFEVTILETLYVMSFVVNLMNQALVVLIYKEIGTTIVKNQLKNFVNS